MDIEELNSHIIESFSISDLSKKVYGYSNSKSTQKLNIIISENKLDISHFSNGAKNRKYVIVTEKCPQCNNTYETVSGGKKRKETCSRSCSNKYFRGKKSEETKIKISEKLKRKKGNIKNAKYCKECVICNNQFKRKRLKNDILSNSKTCSKKCNSKLRSINTKKNDIKKNRRRITQRLEQQKHRIISREILQQSFKK